MNTKSRTTSRTAPTTPTNPIPELKCAYPYFGNKSGAAHLMWPRIGDVCVLSLAFAGSTAELLKRPADHRGGVEVINDIDAFVANFWRAVQAEPQTVARHADWPINETDMEARHKWLCDETRKTEFARRMRNDPHYYCAKTAGWWVWGISAWIGSGWCGRSHKPGATDERGWMHLPAVLGGSGVHRKKVNLVEWFQSLQARMRRVRVLCHDWKRAVRPSIVNTGKLTGVILDPPYSADAGRSDRIYRCENLTVAHEARDWAVANGDNPNLRIALCGYDGEHLMPKSWTEVAWTNRGGFGNLSARRPGAEGRGRANRIRERIWFSPHCIDCGDLPGGVVIHAASARSPRASRHRKGGSG
jgi:hypothetical protein